MAAVADKRQSAVLKRRSSDISAINASPTGSAAARQAAEMSSAGVVTAASSIVCSMAGHRFSSRKASAATMATVSKKARSLGEAFATSAVMRMCSPRRKATTAPRLTSHRKSSEATSSDHTSGIFRK